MEMIRLAYSRVDGSSCPDLSVPRMSVGNVGLSVCTKWNDPYGESCAKVDIFLKKKPPPDCQLNKHCHVSSARPLDLSRYL